MRRRGRTWGCTGGLGTPAVEKTQAAHGAKDGTGGRREMEGPGRISRGLIIVTELRVTRHWRIGNRDVGARGV